jgi:hypothetical protein
MTAVPAIRDVATVARYEARMQLRRPAFWVTAALVFGAVGYRLLDAGSKSGAAPIAIGWAQVLRGAAQRSLLINILFPLGAGLLAADRMSRDRSLRTGELFDSLGLPAAVRLWGKLAGTGGSLALVALGYTLAAAGYAGIRQDGPAAPVAGLMAFAAIGLPAVLFVTAFGLVGGDLLGRAAYLTLFIGYWFWGNLVDPHAIPSLSCTLLSPVGGNVSAGLFGGTALYAGVCSRPPVDPAAADAVASELVVLAVTVTIMIIGPALLTRRHTPR